MVFRDNVGHILSANLDALNTMMHDGAGQTYHSYTNHNAHYGAIPTSTSDAPAATIPHMLMQTRVGGSDLVDAFGVDLFESFSELLVSFSLDLAIGLICFVVFCVIHRKAMVRVCRVVSVVSVCRSAWV